MRCASAIGGLIRDGVASFGTRPTFDNGAPLLEVHRVRFRRRPLRRAARCRVHRLDPGGGEFDSAEALVRRMDDDARLARAALARAGDVFPPLGEIS